jgi:hypothetical protein
MGGRSGQSLRLSGKDPPPVKHVARGPQISLCLQEELGEVELVVVGQVREYLRAERSEHVKTS